MRFFFFPKFFKAVFAVLILFIGVFVSKYLITHKVQPEKKSVKILPPIVKVINVCKNSKAITINASGRVVPLRKSLINTEVSGKIVYISPNFLNGRIVEKGEVLAKIDKSDYVVALKNAEASYHNALLYYEKIRNEADRAIAEWNKEKNRFNLKKPSNLRLYKPQLKSAKSEVQAAEANLSLAKCNLERTVIKAPYKGIVRNKSIDIGSFAVRGTPVCSLLSVENVEIITPVPDFDYPFIDFKKKKVKVSLKLKNKVFVFKGFLDRSEKIINSSTNMINIYTIVESPYKKIGKTIPLFIGAFVNVELPGKQFDNIYRIPLTAIRDKNEIWIADNKRLIIKKVKILKISKNYAFVKAALKENFLLITGNLPYVSNGMKIRYLQ